VYVCDGHQHVKMETSPGKWANVLQSLCYCDDPRKGQVADDVLYREYHDKLLAEMGLPPMYVVREMNADERKLHPNFKTHDGREFEPFVNNGTVGWRPVKS